MKKKIENIEIDDDIYPRQQFSQKTIKSYIEALDAGADFPPITIQKITEDEEEKTIIIDGAHRLKAFDEAGRKEIDAVFWKDEVMDKADNLKELRVESISRNLTHGDRLTEKDKKEMCQTMAEEDSDITITQQEFADIFGVGQQTISDWIGSLRAGQKETRNSLIYKLSFLGWMQQKIADVVGTTQQRVQQITNNTDFGKICNEYQEGKSVEEIADYRGLDLQTTWAILLKGKNDLERFEELNIKLKTYDVWNYSGCNSLMGTQKYPGRVPGQMVMNLLYYYTEQGDRVVDFMAGSGTTSDACLLLNRKCISYDINPVRDFIRQHDILEDGLPEISKTPDLIFTDPPYWSMKEKEYGSVSALPLKEYYEFIKRYGEECYELLNDGGKLAFLIQDQTGKDIPEGKEAIQHTDECSRIFESVGFEKVRNISCPQGTQGDTPQETEKGKKDRKMLGIYRDLMVFRKKEKND